MTCGFDQTRSAATIGTHRAVRAGSAPAASASATAAGPRLDGIVIATIAVYRSVRVSGDTKTKRSRRRLPMPFRSVPALQDHGRLPSSLTDSAALVFATLNGTELDAHNVRRSFRRVVAAAGMNAGGWTPRELRHSFDSLLSDSGVPLEHISGLVGHSGSAVTEAVYRHQLRPVLEHGATVMNKIFAVERDSG